MATSFKIEGLEELDKAIAMLGKIPQKCVTKSAKKGANIALKAARNKAPYETGELSKGIVLKKEKQVKSGKAVYDVTMDSSKNDIFVKMSGDKRYYYPASQEYGYMTKNGGYVPGVHYMRDSLVNNKSQIEETIVEVLSTEIDKALKG